VFISAGKEAPALDSASGCAVSKITLCINRWCEKWFIYAIHPVHYVVKCQKRVLFSRAQYVVVTASRTTTTIVNSASVTILAM